MYNVNDTIARDDDEQMVVWGPVPVNVCVASGVAEGARGKSKTAYNILSHPQNCSGGIAAALSSQHGHLARRTHRAYAHGKDSIQASKPDDHMPHTHTTTKHMHDQARIRPHLLAFIDVVVLAHVGSTHKHDLELAFAVPAGPGPETGMGGTSKGEEPVVSWNMGEQGWVGGGQGGCGPERREGSAVRKEGRRQRHERSARNYWTAGGKSGFGPSHTCMEGG